jgi:AAT family amino acid transporter
MIIMGLVIICSGLGNGGEPVGISNLWKYGGFLPNGIHGLLLSLVIVMFSFGGVELIGITAGEAQDPKETIPKAINQIVWRILIFYIGSLFVMMAIFPWNKIGTAGSPFVEVFAKIGIPAAADILNAVVLTAALSAYNSSLYSNGRMLHGLALQGNAPKIFKKVSSSGTPVSSVLFSSALTLAAVIMNFLIPGKVFLYLISIATIAVVFSWSMILITEIKFRKNKGKEAHSLEFKMPLFPIASYISLAFLAMIVVLMAFIPDMRYSLYVAPIWIILLYAGYRIAKSRKSNSN